MNKVIAVTGYNGRLGKVLIDDCHYLPLECDVTDEDSVKDAIDNVKPDVIIHCAAVTDVDLCETDLYSKALEVNGRGTHLVRSSFRGQMIYLSTDYIFDGTCGPYDEKAKPNPISHYGRTKLYGEEEILEADYPTDIIVRTTILYGGHKPDFVTHILAQLMSKKQFFVNGAIKGNPTNVHHLAKAISKLVTLNKPPKIINIVGRDVISRWGFAFKIAEAYEFPVYNILLTMRGRDGFAQRPLQAGLKVELAESLGLPIYSLDEGLKLLKENAR